MIIALVSAPTFAQRSGHLEPTENYDYRVNDLKGANWIITITPTSKYTDDGIPKSLSSEVRIEEKRPQKVHLYKVKIPKYPHEDGVAFIDMGNLSEPLFLLVSKGGPLSDDQRELHLISPGCSKPLATATAAIEDSSQVEIQTGTKDFVLSFPSPKGGRSKKTWTAPSDSSKLCQQRWR